jgi:hypothetical protein
LGLETEQIFWVPFERDPTEHVEVDEVVALVVTQSIEAAWNRNVGNERRPDDSAEGDQRD